MKLASLFFSLLLARSCFGQPAPINRRAFALSGLATSAPLLPPGMALRWKASDLSGTPVTFWTDEIQGFNWSNSAAARPTWNASGVTFNGSSQFLYTTGVVNQVAAPVYAGWLFVLKFNSTGDGQMVACQAFAGGQIFIGINTADKLYNASSIPVGPIGTSVVDVFTCCNSSDSKFYVYTNGVASQYAAQSGSFNSLAGALTYIGSGAGNGFGSFTLKEVIKWTNHLFSPSEIANVHKYSTNTYGYTP